MQPKSSMQPKSPVSPFEVYCQRCRVTFPINAKRCLHCGGRLSNTRSVPPIVFEPSMQPSMQPSMPPPLDLPDEETPRRTRGISPISILWIAVALAVGVQRACSS